MTGRASSGRSRRTERGGISWVTLLLLAAVSAGGYLGWVWAPLWFELYTVKQVVRDHMNQAIKNFDDRALRRSMVDKIRSLAQVDAVDRYGRPERVPAIDVDEGRVTWQRDTSAQPARLRVAFQYERQVVYPILERSDRRVFEVDLSGELSRADWGPAR